MGAPTIAAAVIQLGAVGLQAYAQKKSGDYNADVDRNNAMLASAQAADAANRGGQEASAIRQQGRAISARALSAIGANGIESTTGSGAAALATTSANAEVDATRAEAAGARAAWGYTFEAQNLQAQAQRTRRLGMLGSLGSLAGGVGSIVGGIGGE